LDDVGHLGVRIVDAESRAAFVPVTLLRDTVDGVWVAGLPEKADVIIVGQEFVIDGVAVKATFSESKP
jgi:membrane fusion protein, multidrug efflux system